MKIRQSRSEDCMRPVKSQICNRIGTAKEPRLLLRFLDDIKTRRALTSCQRPSIPSSQ